MYFITRLPTFRDVTVANLPAGRDSNYLAFGGSSWIRTNSPLQNGFTVRRSSPTLPYFLIGTSYEIRTRVPAVKGRCPRPLDERCILDWTYI